VGSTGEEDMPLYQLDQNTASQIKPASFQNERELQRLFESNLETLMGVRFIATEFTTGERHRGRIDTLGLDQDGSPTIIEYKKTSKDNVINQGLFYLDWLVDHKGDFTLAAQEALGNDIEIDWTRPRLILIAESFSRYDEYAVKRIGANIELWAYRLYGGDKLYLEPLFVADVDGKRTATRFEDKEVSGKKSTEEAPTYSLEDHLEGKSDHVKELFRSLRERVLALGDEESITEKANKMYIGYKHGKNFTEVRMQAKGLKLWLDIPFSDLDDPHQLGRDVSELGHYGTGQVEVKLDDLRDLDKVMALIERAYQQTL
jgi:predicted transport protein